MSRLSILMHRDLDTGEWYVDRVEAEYNRIRTQTRFGVPYPMRLAFSDELVEYLQDHLPTSTGPSAVVVDQQGFPSLALTFSNLKIITQRALAGLQSVSIRVHHVVGNISRIYSQRLLLEAGPPQPTIERLENHEL